MKPTLDRSRGPRSRLFGIPVPPRLFEPLAIVGAFICIVAHLVAIPGFRELAAQGGIMEEEIPGWYRTTNRILLASFAANLLALLRIWWCGHSRQGVVLVFYAIVTSALMVYLLSYMREQRHGITTLEGSDFSMVQPVFLLCAIVGGTLLYGGYDLVTRSRRRTKGPTLAAGLVLLIGVAVAGASWTALRVRSVFVRETFARYHAEIPESATADPRWDSGRGDWPWVGAALGVDDSGRLTFYSLTYYVFLPGVSEDLFEDEGPDGPPTLEDLHEWLLEVDSGVHGAAPSMQSWLDNSLFLAPKPEQRFEVLTELLDAARETFPERPTVGLLTCRRYGRSQDLLAMFTGEDVAALHSIPLETLAISGAPTVRVGARDSRMVLELNGETVGTEEDLTARLASDRPEGVNLTSHPAVSVDYLVGVLDAIRSAGVTRVAIPPVARDGE